MAKVSFSKLGLSKNTNINIIEYNGQNIEVKQYLPINDKATLVAQILNYTLNNGENRFPNPLQVETFLTLNIIEKYTNINFTDKQKEDPTKLYDMLISSGLVAEVVNAIPEAEYHEVLCGISDSIDAIYTYRNSVMGILENISTDYSNLDLDATNIQKKLADPENMALLKQVLTKLG